MFRRVTFSLVLATSLSACATYSWYHPTKSQSEFAQDNYTCIQQSAQAFPVLIQQRTSGTGYTTSSQTSCSTSPGQINCTTNPGTYHPPAAYSVDVNQANRTALAYECMNARGWTLRKNP
jgi:hypothetical protein